MSTKRFFFWNQESDFSQGTSTKLVEAIQAANLDAGIKDYLNTRWLSQVTWWEMRAAHSRTMFHTLRVIGLIAAVVVTALAGISLATPADWWVRLATVVFGAITSISVGIETIFQFGDTWRQKRRIVEKLKVEGWRFLSGVEPYGGERSTSFMLFAQKVEAIIESEIDQYIEAIQEAPLAPQ